MFLPQIQAQEGTVPGRIRIQIVGNLPVKIWLGIDRLIGSFCHFYRVSNTKNPQCFSRFQWSKSIGITSTAKLIESWLCWGMRTMRPSSSLWRMPILSWVIKLPEGSMTRSAGKKTSPRARWNGLLLLRQKFMKENNTFVWGSFIKNPEILPKYVIQSYRPNRHLFWVRGATCTLKGSAILTPQLPSIWIQFSRSRIVTMIEQKSSSVVSRWQQRRLRKISEWKWMEMSPRCNVLGVQCEDTERDLMYQRQHSLVFGDWFSAKESPSIEAPKHPNSKVSVKFVGVNERIS